MMTKSELCLQCLRCCKHLRFEFPVWAFTMYHVEFYTARGCTISKEGDVVYVLVPHTCRHLTPMGCSIYEERPKICRDYDGRDDPTVDCLWRGRVFDDDN